MKIKLSHSTHESPDLKKNHLLRFHEGHLNIDLADSHPYYWRELQKAGRQCDQMGFCEIELSGTWTLEEQWAFYQGYSRPKNPGKIHFATLNSEEKKQLKDWIKVSEWVKHQINLGPDECTPLKLAHAAEAFIREVADEQYTIETEYLTGEELNHHGFVGCYNVGRGSQNPPVLFCLRVYPQNAAGRPIQATLVGKGITFDSGGYALKGKNDGLTYMKCDMGGAATVTGALALALSEGLTQPVELILCCAENMVSGHAYRPGDMLRYKNGVTVEVINTDAEGRLVLADGLIKAQEHKPRLIIDVATLTGASQIAVGVDFCSLFTQDRALRQTALDQAEICHENLWPLPLEDWHQELVPSIIADTANAYTTPMPAGASIAAGFLQRFIEPKQKWLHYDLSNVFHVSANGMWGGGATASMVRSIAKTLLAEI